MKFYKKRLSSGIRLITIPIKNSSTVTTLVMVEAGSKYEEKSENGISHFLEHMCFKGTKRRSRSIDISKELDGLGADSNALTHLEWTAYYAKARPKHLPRLINLVSDVYLNPTFPPAEIEKEKGVIIQEINRDEDAPQRNVMRQLQKLLYGDQPAGRSVLGEKGIIRRLTQRSFFDYHRRHYVAAGTIVAIAGKVEPRKVEKLVNKAFEKVSKTGKHTKRKIKEAQKKVAFLIRKKKTAQVHLAFGFRAFPANHKLAFAAELLSTILGRGMSSRLWQRLREELAVCYYVYSSFDSYTDHGLLSIVSGVDSKRVGEVIETVLYELRRTKKEKISSDELEKAKEYFLGQFFMSLEGSDDVAFFASEQEVLRGKVETPETIASKIKSVTAADVQRAASKIFTDKKLSLAVIGNLGNTKSIKKSLRI